MTNEQTETAIGELRANIKRLRARVAELEAKPSTPLADLAKDDAGDGKVAK